MVHGGVRWCTYLHRVVVDVEAEGDALVERRHRLLRAVDVADLLRLHVSALVVDGRLDHPVSDRLRGREMGYKLGSTKTGCGLVCRR